MANIYGIRDLQENDGRVAIAHSEDSHPIDLADLRLMSEFNQLDINRIGGYYYISFEDAKNMKLEIDTIR